ncbi:hypothetical protein FS749_004341 [Ceratobasidium sp. UAMH 11750]|nr:hypothetical protein FS749_004341 [Ceratobasidium sp. UAMH 11750]
MSASGLESAVHRVFTTPELLAAIAENIESWRSAPLLPVNRFFFRTTAFRRWAELGHLDYFLRLITEREPPPGDDTLVTPVLLELSSAQRERVSFYARLVRVLCVGRQRRGYEWLDLDSLTRTSALFPNLFEIQIVEPMDGASYPFQLGSILSVFCDPERCSIIRGLSIPLGMLVEDSYEHQIPWITSEEALPALDAVLPFSPHIRHLDFPVVTDPNSDFFGGWPRLVQALSQMTNLTTLALGCDSLREDVVLALGNLPMLSSLTLFSVDPLDQEADQLSNRLGGLAFEDALFPRLSELTCSPFSVPDALTILNIQPMVAGIRLLALDLTPVDCLDPRLQLVFGSLRSVTRRLESLYLRLPWVDFEDRHHPKQLQRRDLVSDLFHIGLKRVHIVHLVCPPDAPGGFMFEHSASWRDTLTHLRLGSVIRLQDLPALTALSALEVLYAPLLGLIVPSTEGTASLSPPRSPRTIHLKSNFMLQAVHTDAVALFLLSCWDSLVLEWCGDVDEPELVQDLRNWLLRFSALRHIQSAEQVA